MKKITKKEFIETLCSATTAQIVVKRGKALTESDVALIKRITSANAEVEYKIEPEWRTVVKRQSNAVMFSNGSGLYFDQVGDKKYYRVGDTILQITTDGDYTLTLGYLIKR